MKTQSIPYSVGGASHVGYLAYEEFIPYKRPIILITPTWQGLNGFIKEKARDIARLGYIAFAVDVYGEGKETPSPEEAGALMMPYFLNRAFLREKMNGALQHARTLSHGDPERVGAIGFCFGGLATIELLRSGANLRGVVAFHAVLGDRMGEKKAHLSPNASHIPASILLLHGINDPLVPMEDVVRFQEEMTQAKVDWQVHVFCSVGHAFTNPEAVDEAGGMFFDPLTSQRSFQAMQNFFAERLQ
jgi:dienelactone hydrolase